MIFFVAIDGDDAASGDADHPFATIRHGLDRVQAGDTLTVRPGLYRERLGEVELNGTPDAPILMQAEPGVSVRPTSIPPYAECVDPDRDAATDALSDAEGQLRC